MRKIDPDCLVFDVDGVLVYSIDTFVEIIRLLVEGEWKKSGKIVDAPGYTYEMNKLLKAHGSFNEDYDIAWFLLNFASSRETEKLSEGLPSIDELRELISDCGSTCAEWVPLHFETRFDLNRIKKLGLDMYTGDDGSGGMWKRDKPMIASKWSELPLPVYIYSGRYLREWRFAQDILGWGDFPDERTVLLDTGIHKPSPKGLEMICSKFGHERPVFLGDTMSDKLSSDAFGRGWFAAIGDILKDRVSDKSLSFPDTETALSAIFCR